MIRLGPGQFFETYDVVGTRSEDNGAESGCGSLEGDNSGVTNFFD